jgi:radical SAM protein with 4Fe4S-binding SPASM domain
MVGVVDHSDSTLKATRTHSDCLTCRYRRLCKGRQCISDDLQGYYNLTLCLKSSSKINTT